MRDDVHGNVLFKIKQIEEKSSYVKADAPPSGPLLEDMEDTEETKKMKGEVCLEKPRRC